MPSDAAKQLDVFEFCEEWRGHFDDLGQAFVALASAYLQAEARVELLETKVGRGYTRGLLERK